MAERLGCPLHMVLRTSRAQEVREEVVAQLRHWAREGLS